MRKLFLSFTSTLGLIARGEVSEADLMSGLFYFGCTREHAVAPWGADHGVNELEWCFKHPETREYDADRAAVGHGLLLKALHAAEEEGRVAWRANDEHQTYEVLDGLLVRNGHGSIREYMKRWEWNETLYAANAKKICSRVGIEAAGRI